MMDKINVTIWNEFFHETTQKVPHEIFPEGIHGALAAGLAAPDFNIRTATLNEPENGLPQEVVDSTDVMLWWGHCRHHEVSDEVAKRVRKRVLEGMGLIVLHSGHFSKVFTSLMGTSCSLKWREAGEKCRLWNIAPTHPITQGIGEYFELPHEEMYGERFDVPEDGKLIFMSWFEGGDVFRSGLTFERGYGKIFYFQPGHETFRSYYDANVLKVISNAIRWAKPVFYRQMEAPMTPALEDIRTVNPNTESSAVFQNADGSNK